MKNTFNKIFLYNRYFTWVGLLFSFFSMIYFIMQGNDCEGGEDNISLFIGSRFWPSHLYVLFETPIKIFFRFIMALPAQLGFSAVKITNAVLACLTACLAGEIFIEGKYIKKWMVVIAVLFTPMYYLISLTALSEILFSFWLLLCIFLYQRKSDYPATLLLSLLPFIRSEGFIVWFVFIIYLIWNRRLKTLLVLPLGLLLVTFSGLSFHNNNIFWVFTENYGDASSIYGSGSWIHFITHSRWLYGPLFTVLIPLGLLISLFKLKNNLSENSELIFLLCGSFFGFLALHSYLWYAGKGASLGLIRVMASVIPAGIVVGMYGLSFIMDKFNIKVLSQLIYGLLTFHVFSCFYINKLPYPADMEHIEIEKLVNKSGAIIKEAPAIRFTSFYFAFLSGIDPYAKGMGNCWTINDSILKEMKKGSLIQYETHFGPNECGFDTTYFDRLKDFEKVIEIRPEIPFRVLNNFEYKTAIFRKK